MTDIRISLNKVWSEIKAILERVEKLEAASGFGFIAQMEDDYATLSTAELNAKYAKYQHQTFAKWLGASTGGNETAIIERVKAFLASQ